MCKVYNTIGSLTKVKSYLQQHNINEFKSLNEVIKFQKNYGISRQQIFSNHTLSISQERFNLKDEIPQLKTAIETKKSEVEQQLKFEIASLKQKLEGLPYDQKNYFDIIFNYLKKINLKINIRNRENSFNNKIENSVEDETNKLIKKNNRYQFIESNFNDAVKESCLKEVQEHDRKKNIVGEIESFIYGALGEQKVVKELEKLSDDYILINDFTFMLNPPIYNRKENDYIKSVQIDHILVTPSGVFQIETKNWSEKSLKDLSLYSPVKQIKRASFVLFKILAGDFTNSKLILDKHHWGDRKIPIRNLIVLINQKPIEEFQFVKILTLKELLNYVEYFTPCFSNEETEIIANYLLNIKNT